MSNPSTAETNFAHARELSPRRSTSTATDVAGLVAEQLAHYSIDPKTELGSALGRLAEHIYRANIELHQLWDLTTAQLGSLDRRDRIAYFNAKKFLCFQLAKLLDTLQNPFRHAYPLSQLSGHHSQFAQHLRRRISIAARLVPQAEQSGHRRRVFRRLRCQRFSNQLAGGQCEVWRAPANWSPRLFVSRISVQS